MRALPLLLFASLLAGCSGAPPADETSEVDQPDDRPMPVVIGAAQYQLGLPATGPVQTSAGLGLSVPANATHLLVEVTIVIGASVGLLAEGVPGCDHSYADPQTISEAPLVYECDATPGMHTLRFSHQGGRIDFEVLVTASPPAPADDARQS